MTGPRSVPFNHSSREEKQQAANTYRPSTGGDIRLQLTLELRRKSRHGEYHAMTGRFTVLASGSSGNAALLETDGFGLLIDCGLHPRMLTGRLQEIGAG